MYKKPSGIKTIEEVFNKGRQSVNFKGIYKFGSLKLRVTIIRDSYDFQNRCKVEVFNQSELKWNHVDSIHYNEMKSNSVFYQKSPEQLSHSDKSSFRMDTNRLLNSAKTILS